MMTSPDSLFMKKELLHVKPVSAHLLHGIQSFHAAIYQSTNDRWHGRSIKFIATTLTYCGYAASIPIALIESVAGALLSCTTLLIQATLARNNVFLEKYAIKTLSYCLHGLGALAISIASIASKQLFEIVFPTYLCLPAVVAQGLHLGAAAAGQYFGAVVFNALRGCKNDLPITRASRALIEGLPAAFTEIVTCMNRDFEPFGWVLPDPQAFIEEYMGNLPSGEREWMDDFNLRDLLSDPQQHPLYSMIHHFMENIEVKGEGTSTIEIPLDIYSARELDYQRHMKSCVTKGVQRMVENLWVVHLDRQNGADVLEGFYPEATIPLANISQLMELEVEILCPESFEHADLQRYNSRHTSLQYAKQEWLRLTAEDKELLIERLITTSAFELGERPLQNPAAFDRLYQIVSSLSGDYHQGKLLSSATINLRDLSPGVQHHFGETWREAVNSLNA